MHHVGAIVVGMVGSLTGSVIAIFAQSGTDFGPWAQVGGTATAVGALAYVAKLLADGRLVAQPIAELAKSAERREARLAELVEDSHKRESDLRSLLIQQQRGERGGQ